jgi:hypothetical protein
MEPVIEFGTALYYPHIQFYERRWLRTAALYHDHLGRIVPSGFSPRYDDSPETREIYQDIWSLTEAGFIQDEDPAPFTAAVSNAFYELALANTDPERRAKLLPVLPNADEPFTIYRQKLDPTLLQLMEDMKLARPLNEYEIEADPICGVLYMRTLAEHMAAQRPLVTDDPVFEAMANAPNPQGGEMAGDKGFLLANAIFRTSVPLDIEKVPRGDLLKFREDNQDARLAFYNEIRKMAGDLAKLRNPRQITSAVDHYANTVDAAVNRLESKLRLLNVACAPAVFGVSLPGWLTTAWGLGVTNPVSLFGTLGVVLAVVIVKSVGERKLVAEENTVGYVHYMRKHLTPHQYAEDLVQLNLSGREVASPLSLRYRAGRWLRKWREKG